MLQPAPISRKNRALTSASNSRRTGGGGPDVTDEQLSAKGVRRTAALWSLAGALVILALKFSAYALTGSIGLLSDAAESLVNLVAAIALIWALNVSASPPDYQHPYGHTKAEYLSSVLEAALILLAAASIGWLAFQRLLAPQPLANVGVGLVVAGVAAAVNGVLAAVLGRVARRHDSDALAANSKHLMTDVWTSLGVIGGVLLVNLTGWHVLDPLVALLVAVNIVAVGVKVMRRSLSRLLDERLPEAEEGEILAVLDARTQVLGYHRLRTRRSGRARFAEVDVFVAPETSVAAAHELMVELEAEVKERLGDIQLTVHAEPYVEGVRDVTLTPRDEFD